MSSSIPDVDALIAELDAERMSPGQKCLVCREGTPELRRFIALARERGHSFTAIANKVQTVWPESRVRVSSITNHLAANHDA